MSTDNNNSTQHWKDLAKELTDMADKAFDQMRPYLDKAVDSVEPILKEARTMADPVIKGAKDMADQVSKGARDMADPVLRETREQMRSSIQEIFIQYGDHELRTEDIAARCREDYVLSGGDITQIKDLRVYVKPEDDAAYYVINGSRTGKVALC